MPRRRPAKPRTPESLPEPPPGAIKKPYYPHPNNVYYLKDPTSTEWSRGSVHESTTSTTMHYILDEYDGEIYQVYTQYIRQRPIWD